MVEDLASKLTLRFFASSESIDFLCRYQGNKLESVNYCVNLVMSFKVIFLSRFCSTHPMLLLWRHYDDIFPMKHVNVFILIISM